jgi:hypothetical protein
MNFLVSRNHIAHPSAVDDSRRASGDCPGRRLAQRQSVLDARKYSARSLAAVETSEARVSIALVSAPGSTGHGRAVTGGRKPFRMDTCDGSATGQSANGADACLWAKVAAADADVHGIFALENTERVSSVGRRLIVGKD